MADSVLDRFLIQIGLDADLASLREVESLLKSIKASGGAGAAKRATGGASKEAAKSSREATLRQRERERAEKAHARAVDAYQQKLLTYRDRAEAQAEKQRARDVILRQRESQREQARAAKQAEAAARQQAAVERRLSAQQDREDRQRRAYEHKITETRFRIDQRNEVALGKLKERLDKQNARREEVEAARRARHAKRYIDILRDGYVGLIGIAAGVSAALSRMIATSSKEVEDNRRLGLGLGLGTQGAFEMQHVFQAMGADVNDVSDALQTLSDYSLEALAGNEEWVKTFKAANVQIGNLKDKRPDELLEVLADSISGLANAEDRAAAAARIFGDDVGRKLLPLLTMGGDAVRELRQEYRDFAGIVTEEAAEANGQFVISMRRVWLGMKGLQTLFVTTMAPHLRDMATNFLNLWKSIVPYTKSETWKWALRLGESLSFLSSPLGRFIATTAGLLAFGKALMLIYGTAKQLPIVGTMLTQIGAAAAVIAKPLAILTALYLIIEDLYYASQGYNSASGELAETLGVGSEFQTALFGMVELFKSAAFFAWQLATALTKGVGRGLGLLARLIPSLKPIADELQKGVGGLFNVIGTAGLTAGAALDESSYFLRSANRGEVALPREVAYAGVFDRVERGGLGGIPERRSPGNMQTMNPSPAAPVTNTIHITLPSGYSAPEQLGQYLATMLNGQTSVVAR